MPDVQQKKAAAAKEPVEITCSECQGSFRLWIPADSLGEWERGSRISCVRCGAQFLLRWTGDGFDVNPVSELLRRAAEKTQATSEPAAAAQPQPLAQAPAPAPADPQQPVATVAAPGAETVLVIEDDRLSREMVENTLAALGFSVIAARSSTEAMRSARGRVNLIITDLYLKNPADPESLLDGEDLLARLRESGVTAPAIITTGKDIIDDLVLDPKWFDLNVKGFIQKGNPFWVEELRLKVKEVLYKG